MCQVSELRSQKSLVRLLACFMVVMSDGAVFSAEPHNYSKIQEEHIRLVSELVQALRGDTSDYEKAQVLATIGTLRAVEAAPSLVAMVTFIPQGARVGEPHPLRSYPAALALTRIGEPAYGAIFERLRAPATGEELHVLAYALAAVDGKIDRSYGMFFVDRQLRETEVGTQRENLTRLKELMSAPQFGRDWPKPLNAILRDKVDLQDLPEP